MNNPYQPPKAGDTEHAIVRANSFPNDSLVLRSSWNLPLALTFLAACWSTAGFWLQEVFRVLYGSEPAQELARSEIRADPAMLSIFGFITLAAVVLVLLPLQVFWVRSRFLIVINQDELVIRSCFKPTKRIPFSEIVDANWSWLLAPAVKLTTPRRSYRIDTVHVERSQRPKLVSSLRTRIPASIQHGWDEHMAERFLKRFKSVHGAS